MGDKNCEVVQPTWECHGLEIEVRDRMMITLRTAGETLENIRKLFHVSRSRAGQITGVNATYGRARKSSHMRCPISDQDLKALVKEEGSVHQVALAMKSSDHTVARWVKDAGLKLVRKSIGGRPQKKMPERGIVELEYNRRTCAECAAFFNVSCPTLNRWIDIYKIARKRRKHPTPLDDMTVTEIQELIAKHGTRDTPGVIGVHYYTLASKLEELGIDNTPIIEETEMMNARSSALSEILVKAMKENGFVVVEEEVYDNLVKQVAGHAAEAEALRALRVSVDLKKGVFQNVRDEVLAMAVLMELHLRENDFKGGWATCDADWLLEQLKDECVELREAHGCSSGYTPGEAADVANYAMMFVDNTFVGGIVMAASVRLEGLSKEEG